MTESLENNITACSYHWLGFWQFNPAYEKLQEYRV